MKTRIIMESSSAQVSEKQEKRKKVEILVQVWKASNQPTLNCHFWSNYKSNKFL